MTKEQIAEMMDKVNDMPSSYWIESPSGNGFSFDMHKNWIRIYSTRENFIDLKLEDIKWIEKMINAIKSNRCKPEIK